MSDQEIKENSLEDNFPDIIARFDKSLRYVSINKRVTDELGFPVAHVIGKTMHELRMPVDVIEKWESGIRAVFDTMTIHTVELDMIPRKDVNTTLHGWHQSLQKMDLLPLFLASQGTLPSANRRRTNFVRVSKVFMNSLNSCR